MPGTIPLQSRHVALAATLVAFAFASAGPAWGLPRPSQSAGEPLLFTPAGFNRPGRPATAAGPRTGRLRVVVRDHATGKPTPCRINVVGPDGNFYQPKADH